MIQCVVIPVCPMKIADRHAYIALKIYMLPMPLLNADGQNYIQYRDS